MKQTRRIPALLLAMVMLCSLALTGCKKEAPVAADKVAEAIFEMILKDDPSKAVELFGYADESEARADMGLDGSVYEELAGEMTKQFSDAGVNITEEEMQECVSRVKERRMGYLFENIEKMDIQAERRNTAQARAEAQRVREEAQRAQEEAQRTQEEAQENAIRSVIAVCQRLNAGKEQAVQEVIEVCGADRDTALEKVNLYWK